MNRAVCILALAAACASGAALAQQADTREEQFGGPTLDEIIVTAEKRAQPLKDVPISVTAIGPEEIEMLRVQGIEDFILEIPNATFTSFGAFGNSVSLRGINGFSGGVFAPVGVLVDDAGFGAASIGSILSAKFFDLERIEVLRGPQGVLSGRNALGGAINLITAKPDTEAFEFETTLDYSRFDTRFAKAVLNTPINDQLAVRTVGYLEQGDGAVDNIGPSGGSSSTDSVGGRLAVRWQPNEAFTLDASYSYEEQDLGLGTMLRADIFRSPEDRAAVIEELESWGGDFLDTDFFEDVGTNGGTVRLDVDELVTYVNRIGSVAARYQWDRHAAEFKYSHYSYDNQIVFDWDKTEFAWFRGDWLSETSSDSAEIKISSQYDGDFNWVAGLGYLDEETGSPGSDAVGEWADGANGGIPVLAGNYRLADVFDFRVFLESLGFFANGFWDLGERWHLSAGGRFSLEKTRVASFFIDDPADPRFFRGAPVVPADFSEEADITEFSPRIALNFDITDDVTSYVQYATGYRAGYGNAARAIELGAPPEVEPETVKSYELGLKGQVLDDRLFFALALFYMDYEDLQVTITEGDPGSDPTDPIPFTFDSNAGASVSQGVELEGSWLVTDALRIDGFVAYTDATLEEFTVDGLDETDTVTFRDVPVLGIRPWTAKISGHYERPITATLRGNVRLSWHYQDEAYTEGLVEAESAVYRVPAFDTVDLSIGVDAGDRWSLTAYAENLLDEDYFLSTQFEAETSRRGGFVSFLPRTYGLRFTMNFGN
jgi:iron complex outermembrane receptor protein